MAKIKKEDKDFKYWIGYTIAECRQKTDYLQYEAANLINVSAQQYCNYERGKTSFSLERLQSICDLLNVNMIAVLVASNYRFKLGEYGLPFEDFERSLVNLYDNITEFKNLTVKKRD